MGYGRIGSVLARRLKGLEARPAAAMRSAAQRARALSDGCEVIRLEELGERLGEFDTVVNTIPAPVLGRELLEKLPPESLIIALASQPGGVDKKAAAELGCRLLHALSLPGKYAPETAGELVGRAVLALLQERGDV